MKPYLIKVVDHHSIGDGGSWTGLSLLGNTHMIGHDRDDGEIDSWMVIHEIKPFNPKKRSRTYYLTDDEWVMFKLRFM